MADTGLDKVKTVLRVTSGNFLEMTAALAKSNPQRASCRRRRACPPVCPLPQTALVMLSIDTM
jgi:hypothetical protein